MSADCERSADLLVSRHVFESFGCVLGGDGKKRVRVKFGGFSEKERVGVRGGRGRLPRIRSRASGGGSVRRYACLSGRYGAGALLGRRGCEVSGSDALPAFGRVAAAKAGSMWPGSDVAAARHLPAGSTSVVWGCGLREPVKSVSDSRVTGPEGSSDYRRGGVPL